MRFLNGILATLVGYTKPASTSAIAAADTITQAIGKLEKGIDLKATRRITAWESDSFTLGLSNTDNRILTQGSADMIITVPTNAAVAFPIDTTIEIFRGNGFEVSIAGSSGVALYSVGNEKRIKDPFAVVKLLKVAENDWNLSGSLKA